MRMIASATFPFALAVVLSGGPSVAGQVRATTNTKQITLTVHPASTTLQLGHPITVNLTLTNHGSVPFQWEVTNPNTAYRSFDYLLTYDGAKVRTTAFHRFIKNQSEPGDPMQSTSSGTMLAVIAPGATVSFTIDLDTLYELRQSGTYTLIASHRDDSTGSVIQSQPINVVIEPE